MNNIEYKLGQIEAAIRSEQETSKESRKNLESMVKDNFKEIKDRMEETRSLIGSIGDRVRNNEEELRDYKEWRKSVEGKINESSNFTTKWKIIIGAVTFLLTSGVLGTILTISKFIKSL